MSNKRTGVQITTPRGLAVYPKLNAPDYKFDKAGKYTCRLRLKADDPAVEAFAERLTKMRDDFLASEVARLKGEKKAALAAELKPAEVLKVERDQETGDPTGYLILNASMKASGVREDGTAWTQKPAIFDAKGSELQRPPLISGGSEVKLSATFDPYLNNTSKEVGVGVRLKGVQILKLVSGGARDFGSLGFQAEEGDEIEDGSGFADESASAGPDANEDI